MYCLRSRKPKKKKQQIFLLVKGSFPLVEGVRTGVNFTIFVELLSFPNYILVFTWCFVVCVWSEQQHGTNLFLCSFCELNDDQDHSNCYWCSIRTRTISGIFHLRNRYNLHPVTAPVQSDYLLTNIPNHLTLSILHLTLNRFLLLNKCNQYNNIHLLCHLRHRFLTNIHNNSALIIQHRHNNRYGYLQRAARVNTHSHIHDTRVHDTRTRTGTTSMSIHTMPHAHVRSGC